MRDQNKQNSIKTNHAELYEIVGRKIKSARKKANLTQDDLAQRVKMTRTSVTNIEKGRQKFLLHTLFDLATEMKVPVTDLIPDPQADRFQIDHKLDLSNAEKEWIFSAVSQST